MVNKRTAHHVSAGGIVYKKTPDGYQWLLIQHKHAKHWGFPKGHIGDNIKGETSKEAARREVLEEGGVRASILSYAPYEIHFYFTLKKKPVSKKVTYYIMEYISGNTEAHDDEVSESKFFPDDEIAQILTYENDKEAFAYAQEKVK